MDAMAQDSATPAAAVPAVFELAGHGESPAEVGNLELDESGEIRKSDNTAPLAFSFRFHDLRFDAEVDLMQDSLVRLTAPLGKLPFTAEAPSERRHIREIIRANDYHSAGRLHLSSTQDITFRTEAEPPAPFTPVSIMATVVSLLLKSQPLLDPIRDMTRGSRRRHA